MELDVNIKILGSGCRECIEIANMIQELVTENHLTVQVEKITGIDEIATFGVPATPAVVIDGDVKCTGRVPDRNEILAWLTKELGEV